MARRHGRRGCFSNKPLAHQTQLGTSPVTALLSYAHATNAATPQFVESSLSALALTLASQRRAHLSGKFLVAPGGTISVPGSDLSEAIKKLL
jgi:hypothetical protein